MPECRGRKLNGITIPPLIARANVPNPPETDPSGKGDAPTFENRNDVPTIYFDIAPAYGVSGVLTAPFPDGYDQQV